jgi:hypothetical protein
VSRTAWNVVIALVLLVGLALRLKGIHNPITDHPGWRQGDTAAIARNFATLEFNPLRPQVDYNGPPPNYVELELQIVPFLAAVLYKIFGIHEVFGRLISIAFSLATIVLVGAFARRLFRSDVAGVAAATVFAIYPGSLYYGRTFTPDTAMVAFMTAALYASFLWSAGRSDNAAPQSGTREGASPVPAHFFWLAAALTALAILAKPVAAVALVPIVSFAIARWGWRATLLRPSLWAFLAIAIVPYLAYDAYLRSIAEWHWASGITAKHVLPELVAAFASPAAFLRKLAQFNDALGMLPGTMLGPIGFGLMLLAIVVPVRGEARVLLAAYFLALIVYTFVVVSVERVDYYLYVWLPFAALSTGGLIARLRELVNPHELWNSGGLALGGVFFALMIMLSRAAVHDYYQYKPGVYRAATVLDATLPPGILVVMAHYDPSVLYYIHRKGWEEDPALWTPFDERSAIKKGARAFISIEDRRMRRNVELCHWLERFPITNPDAPLRRAQDRGWPVYVTDPVKVLPGAEARWQAFRKLELAGKAKPCTRPHLLVSTLGLRQRQERGGR